MALPSGPCGPGLGSAALTLRLRESDKAPEASATSRQARAWCALLSQKLAGDLNWRYARQGQRPGLGGDVIWQDLETELQELFEDNSGFLSWKDREAMSFIRRQTGPAVLRPRMTEDQRRQAARLYHRRWWHKLKQDLARYAAYLRRQSLRRKAWLRSLSREAWLEYRAKANRRYRAFIARIRSNPERLAWFLRKRRHQSRVRLLALRADPARWERHLARRRAQARRRLHALRRAA